MKKMVMVLGLVLFALPGCKGGSDSSSVDADKPVFKQPFTGGVLLRYRYPAGREDKYVIRTTTKIVMKMAGREMEIPMIMNMYSGFKGKGKDAAGNYGVEMLITRMIIEMPKNGLSFDTSDTGKKAFPGSEMLTGMVNKKIGMVITPRGKIVSAETDKILSGLMKGNPKMYQMMKESIANITRNTLNQFPEGPVKAGDKFEAMDYNQNIQGLLKMKVKTSYVVLSVSADRQKVLLKPVMDINFESSNPSMKLETKGFSVSGWLLFDRNTGRVERSKLAMDYGFAMGVSGQKVDAQMRSLIDMRLQ